MQMVIWLRGNRLLFRQKCLVTWLAPRKLLTRYIDMHIYLECGEFVTVDGERRVKKNDQGQEIGTGLFNYRGETSENDDPKTFAEKMANNGLRVIITNEFKGEKKIPLSVLEA